MEILVFLLADLPQGGATAALLFVLGYVDDNPLARKGRIEIARLTLLRSGVGRHLNRWLRFDNHHVSLGEHRRCSTARRCCENSYSLLPTGTRNGTPAHSSSTVAGAMIPVVGVGAGATGISTSFCVFAPGATRFVQRRNV